MKYVIENGELWIVDEELGLLLTSPSPQNPEQLYYPNGNLRMEAHFTHDKLHGPSIFYSEAGVVLSKTWFYLGVAQGKAWHYYPSGKLFSIQRFKDGARVGMQEYYYEDGSPKTFMPYDDQGRLHGVTKMYTLDGTLKRERAFNHGVPLD